MWCSCSYLDRHTNTCMLNFSSACDELARNTVKVMHGWCWYVRACVFIHHHHQQYHDDHNFFFHLFACIDRWIYIFVSASVCVICCLLISSLFSSVWLFINLQAVRKYNGVLIGLTWIWFRFVWFNFFLFIIFFFDFPFIWLFRAILPIHRIYFCTHKIMLIDPSND